MLVFVEVLIISIGPSFIRSVLLHGRQNMFSSLKVVLAMLVFVEVLIISIGPSFIRSVLLHGRQNMFSSLKVVLAMLVFEESRSALPFRRGTDGQNVLKVVLAMLVFVKSNRVGWQKCVRVVVGFMTTTMSVFLVDRYHTAYA
jgi:hypothetical protein